MTPSSTLRPADGGRLRVGIMQPYLLPYLGYFQLIEHCHRFVIYDDIQYTKRGWINRNRILHHGLPKTFTVPLKRASDYLDVRERSISDEYSPAALMRVFEQSYRRAPMWDALRDTLETIVAFSSRNLFEFIFNSIEQVCATTDITTELVVSSSLGIDRSLRGQDRVLATCQELGATEYVNPVRGVGLYDPATFRRHGIELRALTSRQSPYRQFDLPFVEALSIVDAMAFLPTSELQTRVRSDYVVSDPASTQTDSRTDPEGTGYA